MLRAEATLAALASAIDHSNMSSTLVSSSRVVASSYSTTADEDMYAQWFSAV